jgi:RNA recognition motif-containing protein
MEEEKKIYIGNLDYGVTEEDVQTFLDEQGFQPNDLKIITDRMTGRSKGFGFAEFEEAEEASRAIESLNGLELKGRNLRVNQARRQAPRSDRDKDF